MFFAASREFRMTSLTTLITKSSFSFTTCVFKQLSDLKDTFLPKPHRTEALCRTRPIPLSPPRHTPPSAIQAGNPVRKQATQTHLVPPFTQLHKSLDSQPSRKPHTCQQLLRAHSRSRVPMGHGESRTSRMRTRNTRNVWRMNMPNARVVPKARISW